MDQNQVFLMKNYSQKEEEKSELWRRKMNWSKFEFIECHGVFNWSDLNLSGWVLCARYWIYA